MTKVVVLVKMGGLARDYRDILVKCRDPDGRGIKGILDYLRGQLSRGLHYYIPS
jgi:hypothetical protein